MESRKKQFERANLGQKCCFFPGKSFRSCTSHRLELNREKLSRENIGHEKRLLKGQPRHDLSVLVALIMPKGWAFEHSFPCMLDLQLRQLSWDFSSGLARYPLKPCFSNTAVSSRLRWSHGHKDANFLLLLLAWSHFSMFALTFLYASYISERIQSCHFWGNLLQADLNALNFAFWGHSVDHNKLWLH